MALSGWASVSLFWKWRKKHLPERAWQLNDLLSFKYLAWSLTHAVDSQPKLFPLPSSLLHTILAFSCFLTILTAPSHFFFLTETKGIKLPWLLKVKKSVVQQAHPVSVWLELFSIIRRSSRSIAASKHRIIPESYSIEALLGKTFH